MGRSRVYALIDEGKFPPPIKIGRSSRWLKSEIDSWITDQADARQSSQSGFADALMLVAIVGLAMLVQTFAPGLLDSFAMLGAIGAGGYNTIYAHPEGGSISLEDTTLTVTAENGHTAQVQIGPDGLRDTAMCMQAHATDCERAMNLAAMSDQEYLHRIKKIKPLVKVNIIRTRPTIKSLGEMVQEICHHQPMRGGTRIGAYSEADYMGINPEEPDQIELTIEGDTLMLGCMGIPVDRDRSFWFVVTGDSGSS